jgi:hypothetical protein
MNAMSLSFNRRCMVRDSGGDLSPRGEEHGEVEAVGDAVAVEVGGTFGVLRAAAPGTQELREVESVDNAVAAEVSGSGRIENDAEAANISIDREP